MKGKIIKLTDNKFKGKHPNEINEGHTFIGSFESLPEIGTSFTIIHEKFAAYRYFKTSTITKIISQTDNEILFNTLNSTYSLEIIK